LEALSISSWYREEGERQSTGTGGGGVVGGGDKILEPDESRGLYENAGEAAPGTGKNTERGAVSIG
jgi:hypothetical protein